jgi:phytoene dehydrogenase-like protein
MARNVSALPPLPFLRRRAPLPKRLGVPLDVARRLWHSLRVPGPRRRRPVRTAIVIGAGFSGLAAAAHLARGGARVQAGRAPRAGGGPRADVDADGFRFDMGPSWYWMPDVFERFFATFGKQVVDLYSLRRLDPSYRVRVARRGRVGRAGGGRRDARDVRGPLDGGAARLSIASWTRRGTSTRPPTRTICSARACRSSSSSIRASSGSFRAQHAALDARLRARASSTTRSSPDWWSGRSSSWALRRRRRRPCTG